MKRKIIMSRRSISFCLILRRSSVKRSFGDVKSEGRFLPVGIMKVSVLFQLALSLSLEVGSGEKGEIFQREVQCLRLPVLPVLLNERSVAALPAEVRIEAFLRTCT